MKDCTCGSNWTDDYCPRHGSRAGECAECARKDREIADLKRKLSRDSSEESTLDKIESGVY